MHPYAFAKYHGLGNDFILVNCLNDPHPAIDGHMAIAWCNRHTGIGADGVILLLPSERAACRMQILNSDGSEAPMCGNGLRCLVMFARDEQIITANEYSIETPVGILAVRVESDAAGRAVGVRVQMGRPRLLAREVPTTLVPGDQRAIQVPLAAGGQTWQITAVNTGNPQCVVLVSDVAAIDVHRLGPLIEKHPAFPCGVNVMFTQIVNRAQLLVRPWERGAGATLACGTGACAALVAGVLGGHTERRAQVILPGGALHIEWDEQTDEVRMTGPATRVFAGHISDIR